MCGLVGVFGDLNTKDVTFFKNALVADYLRGKHSTGIATVYSGITTVIKKALNPCDFLELSSVQSEMAPANDLIMGHNRHATLGAVNAANAHPFEHGQVVLAHNGTLTNKMALEKQYDAPSFSTDSELVCWLLDNYKADCVIESLEGAFALTWWDGSDNTFNIIHNGEREFNIALSKDKLYYASEEKMLEWLLDRNGIKAAIRTPEIGEHISFTHTKEGIKLKSIKRKLAPKKPKTLSAGGAGWTNRYNPPATTYRSGKEIIKDTHGLDVKIGDVIYATIDSAKSNHTSPTGKKRVDIVGRLFHDCNIPVKVYYTDDNPAYELAGVIIKGTVRNFNGSQNSEAEIILNNGTLSIVESEEHYADLDKWCEEMDYNWLGNMDIPEESEEDVSNVIQTVKGFDDKFISMKKFQDVLGCGCAICGSTFDIDSELVDRTCTFVYDDAVVCSGCKKDVATMASYGFTELLEKH